MNPNYPFAVVDVETTGLYPKFDRLIEIAIITCDPLLNPEDEFTTLINPDRDLGSFNGHNISAGMLINAPAFKEIAGDVIQRLKNRILIGHNIKFDNRMIAAEFERLGYELPELPHVCTLNLSYNQGLERRRLIDCCRHHKIALEEAHSALADARATHQLAQILMSSKGEHNRLSTHLKADMHQLSWPDLPPSGKTVSRLESNVSMTPNYLKDLVSKLSDPGSAEVASYYLILDKALEDRRITAAEAQALESLAFELGLSRNAVLEAHRSYLRNLIQTALSDGTISSVERKDLDCVAELLGFDQEHLKSLIDTCKEYLSKSLHSPNTESLVGMKVCFTGTMKCQIGSEPISREKAKALATEQGLIAVDSLTKATDILVLADPDTMSGKAKKARQYGTRLMSDRVFWQKLGIPVD